MMIKLHIRLVVSGMVLLVVNWGSLSQGQPAIDLTADQNHFFESKIRPVLIRECYSCHSDQVGQIKGGLWLDTRDALLAGGDSGAAVVPGNLEESLLWSAINHLDFAMPPGRKLSDEVIADFRAWIEMGAPDPRIQKESNIVAIVTDEAIQAGREFWSFKKPERTEIPQVSSDWPRQAIDHFVLQQLEAQGLQPSPDADPQTLLRRLSFDLIGLPPSPKLIRQFERRWARNPDQALEQAVDDLLSQPQFGERWGRHWLDVARYAESTGRELNLTFPHAWRYRDYVIDSFNQDKPYNEFVQQQIAGDLLPGDSDQQWAENLIATGFLAIGPKVLRGGNRRQFEMDLVDEQIDVTTRAMMGISVACARCHDHKTDPIPQTDYYALAGIFKSMSTHYGTSGSLQNRHSSKLVVLPINDPLPSDRSISRKDLDQLQSELASLQQDLRQLNQEQRQQRASGTSDANFQRQFARRSAISSRIGDLQTEIDRYDANGNPLTLCMGVQETRPVNLRVLERGELNRPGPTVPRGFPQVLCEPPPVIARSSTGRLEFARWVGSSDNPLTARVMVNRVWEHLFVNGLVRTSDDFGASGERPTHPELLDHLAIEFMEGGWSVKQLIRTIVLSRSYRMSGQYNEDHFLADPDNRWIWRMEPRRLEAEAIRDAMLAISGNLDLQRPLGSPVARAGSAVVRNGRIVPPNLTAMSGNSGETMMGRMVNSGRRTEQQEITNLLENQPNCRSVYLPIVRDHVSRSLQVFDFAETTLVVTKRETSHTPDQGLYFLNNTFVLQQAEAMARRIIGEYNSLERQLKEAFILAYGRPPSPSELAATVDFYNEFEVSSGATRASSQNDPRATGTNRANNRLNNPRNRGRGVDNDRTRAEVESIQRLTAVCQAIIASAEFRFVN